MTDYIIYIDEAGDAAIDQQNSQLNGKHTEWLCMGGYLVTKDHDNNLRSVCDELAELIGGQTGQTLHFRNYSNKNKLKICEALGTKTARAFIVCSYKDTLRNYDNPKASRAGTVTSDRDYVYNYLVRILLERVTEFVQLDAFEKKIKNPKLKIVLSYRKGHNFNHLKQYIRQIARQAENKSTYQKTRVICPEVLANDTIVTKDPKKEPGLQLADIVTSAVYFSIDTDKQKEFNEPIALQLWKVIAKGKHNERRANEGLTLFPPNSIKLLSKKQVEFFHHFGYNSENEK